LKTRILLLAVLANGMHDHARVLHRLAVVVPQNYKCQGSVLLILLRYRRQRDSQPDQKHSSD